MPLRIYKVVRLVAFSADFKVQAETCCIKFCVEVLNFC